MAKKKINPNVKYFIYGVLLIIIILILFTSQKIQERNVSSQSRADELAQEYDITTNLPSCVQNISVRRNYVTPGASEGQYCKVRIICKGYSKNPYDHSNGWQPIFCERRIGVPNQFVCSWDQKNAGSCPSLDGNSNMRKWIDFASYVCGCGDDSNQAKPQPIDPVSNQ